MPMNLHANEICIVDRFLISRSGLDFLMLREDPVVINVVNEKIDFTEEELALRGKNSECVRGKTIENLIEVF